MDYRILGPVEVREGGRPLDIGGGKQRALVALLMLEAGTVVPADRLIEALWGERPPASANKSVQVYVSRLRRLIGPRLVTRGAGYVLELRPGELDLERVELLVSEARVQLDDGDVGAAADRLASALAEWRGRPLADVAYEDFAQPEIRRLEELRLAVLEDRIDADLALGRHAALVPELEAVVAEHRVRERLHGQLMLALYRCGRQADALAALRRLQRDLRDELGLAPSRELQELEAAILRQDEALEPGTRPARGPTPRERRRGPLLVAAGAAAVLVATAAVVAALSGGGSPHTRIQGEGVASVDPATGRVESVAAVAGTPARMAAGGRALWIGADTGRTVSRLDPAATTVDAQVAARGYPSDIAVDGETLWVLDRSRGRLARVSARYAEVTARTRVGAGRRGAFLADRAVPDPWSVAARDGAAWITTGTTRLVRVDRDSARVTARTDVGRAVNGVAVGGGSVWAISGPHATVLRVNPRNGAVRARIRIVTRTGTDRPYPIAVEYGLGSLWVLNANTATVSRIDPKEGGVTATVPIGLARGPLRLAVGAGAAWVANADGTLARIDAATHAVRVVPVANSLLDVAVAAGKVWVSAGRGVGRVDTPAGSSGRLLVAALPPKTCSPIASAPGAGRRLLIAGDLPLTGAHRHLSAQMDAAIRYVLRERGFRAGRHRIAYQVCDDSTIAGGVGDERRCKENALAYARNRSVVGMIGPFGSGCAYSQIPITNRAGLAMLSPSNTYIGLTRGGPGAAPGEPDNLYPTGRRTYARIVADDRVQAAANGLLASRLGVRRLFVLQIPDPYGDTIARGASFAARRLGIRVVGHDTWVPLDPKFDHAALVRRVRGARPDAILLGGALIDNEGELIRRLRRALPRARLLTSDGFAATSRLVRSAGAAAEGLTVTIAGTPPDALGRRGRELVASLTRDLGARPETYSVHAAQAAEVMLDAIARSNGGRAGVVRELFRTRVRDGVLGDFAITATGDTTAQTIAVYRIQDGRQRLYEVLAPRPHLLPGAVRGSDPTR